VSGYARYIVLIAGILGMLGMFQPLFTIGRFKLRTDFSAYELSFKLDKAHALIDKKLPFLVELKLPPDVREARDDIRTIVHASRGAALAYIPSALLLLLGIFAVKRKRLGRPLAGVALLFGIASVAAYIGLKYGIAYGEEEEPLLKRTALHLEIGAKILLAGGVAVVVFSLAELLKPAPRPQT
jgi:hypothetical protein